jgi:hypothetical protein
MPWHLFTKRGPAFAKGAIATMDSLPDVLHFQSFRG